jgi:integrase
LEGSPLEVLKKIDRPERARYRRSFSEVELRRLLDVSGPRSPLYKIAALTGLRKGELRQLQWRDVRLDQTKPIIKLRPEANKARREEVLPLHPAAAATMLSLRPEPFDPLGTIFPVLPRPSTFRQDLKRADIPYRDADRRFGDFHSLRYSFCTMLARAGVPIRTAMELMRHRDPRLTVELYVDAGQLDTDEAVSRLPHF